MEYKEIELELNEAFLKAVKADVLKDIISLIHDKIEAPSSNQSVVYNQAVTDIVNLLKKELDN